MRYGVIRGIVYFSVVLRSWNGRFVMIDFHLHSILACIRLRPFTEVNSNRKQQSSSSSSSGGSQATVLAVPHSGDTGDSGLRTRQQLFVGRSPLSDNFLSKVHIIRNRQRNKRGYQADEQRAGLSDTP